jgi:hypothetical protein
MYLLEWEEKKLRKTHIQIDMIIDNPVYTCWFKNEVSD